ncbi:hypothetical protein [Haloarcula sp. K1]|uniref:hypothetical protein n=1 Tax=Haloarcula sp. K1 TaxID=1622207 RepID=UPI000A8682E5|nr:hypothetical protein [Haloarcula sp. K1]
MTGFSLTSLLVWLRNPEWGIIGAILSFAVIGGSVFSSIEGIIQISAFLVGCLIFLLILFANFYLSGIGVVCLQTNSISSAENHYRRVYPIPDGYAEFDVYFSIPRWLNSFSVEIAHEGPFKIGAWDLPGPVSFNNEVIHCDGDLQKVPFTLRFGGDPQEIGDATYNIRFIDKQTGRKLYSMSLDGDRRIETESESSDLEPDIAESLGIE